MDRYSIVRFFYRDDLESVLVDEGLTLEEAQAHCSDPEASSTTARGDAAMRRTEQFGPWFDGYSAER